jgi:hypothetical protein
VCLACQLNVIVFFSIHKGKEDLYIKEDCLVCLLHPNPPTDDTCHCTLGILGKPSMSRGVPRSFC